MKSFLFVQMLAVLCTLGWGILLPVDHLLDRSLILFKPTHHAWFGNILDFFKIVSLFVGSVGWGIGINLGNMSTKVKYTAHRTTGVLLYSFGLIQVYINITLLLKQSMRHFIYTSF